MGKGIGFWITVDGVKAHILGEENMSEEDLNTLEKLIRAAINTTEDKYPTDEGRECKMCGKSIVYGEKEYCPQCWQVWNS